MADKNNPIKKSGERMEAMVIAYREDLIKGSRPDCPDCGNRMVSQGNNWKCNGCGKYMVKARREKKTIVGREPCPECKNSHIVSRGPEWECRACGRRWKKFYRAKVTENVT